MKWAADQVKEHALDAIKVSAPSDSRATYGELDRQARNSLRDNVANLLLQNGYLSDEAIAGAGQRGTIIKPYPPGAVTTSPDGVQSFSTASDEYRNWVGSSTMTTRLAESVIGVHADQWGAIR